MNLLEILWLCATAPSHSPRIVTDSIQSSTVSNVYQQAAIAAVRVWSPFAKFSTISRLLKTITPEKEDKERLKETTEQKSDTYH